MNRKINAILLALAMTAIVQPAWADWSGKAEVGASMATGNSDNQSANGALEVTSRSREDRERAGLHGRLRQRRRHHDCPALGSPRTDELQLDRARLLVRRGPLDDDRFSAYDYQASLATGLGYKFFDSEETKLWVQGGPGYRVSKERETGDTIDGVIFRGNVGFERQITETTRIVNLFLVEPDRQHLPAEQPRPRRRGLRFASA